MEVADAAARNQAAAEARRHRSRVKKELHDGFSSGEDECLYGADSDGYGNDDDDDNKGGSGRVGYACPDMKEEPYVGHTDFHNRCPYMHGLLSGDNFNLWGDLAQYLVGEVGSTHSSNCSVSSTATNRVHKRSRSLWNKMKRLSIRLSNLLQKIHRPHAKVCMYVLYVCIVCMYLFSQHAANTVEAIPGSKSP